MWNTEGKKSCLSAIFSVPSSVNSENRVVGEEHQYFKCVETFEKLSGPSCFDVLVLVSAAQDSYASATDLFLCWWKELGQCLQHPDMVTTSVLCSKS